MKIFYLQGFWLFFRIIRFSPQTIIKVFENISGKKIWCIPRTGMTAIPPFLHFRIRFIWEKSQNRRQRPCTWLKNLNWIRRASPCCNIWDIPAPNSSPTRFLTLPRQPTARPRQFFSIKEATTRAHYTKAIMASQACMDTSMLKKSITHIVVFNHYQEL